MNWLNYKPKMNKQFFKDKKILVMGLGRFGGGVDVVKFACDAGAKVTVTDLAPPDKLADSINQLKDYSGVEYHLGSHNPADFEQADIIVANPAVPNDNNFLEIARKAGRLVTSQINIFFELCPAVIIGTTGANGKSTTAALTAHLLRAGLDSRLRGNDRRKVWLSGNIGNEPLLTITGQISRDDLVVLELSSFQIEQLAQIQKMPAVALLTNLTPNHLDRYGTFENYCAAKENIFKFQKPIGDLPPVSIFNAEDKIAAEWFEKYGKDKNRICIKFSPEDVGENIRAGYALPGWANLSNLAAALAIARYFGVDDKTIKKHLPEFKALPHRLQLVTTIKGVQWYNDSKATTPDSTIVALEAFDQPQIIIAGGYDKHIPFDKLGEKIAQKTKAAILIGQTAQKIADAINKTQDSRHKTQVGFAGSLAKAVQMANELAVSGDVVLLSTACASYDMFENYEQRGRQFIELVMKLGGSL
jgi:UDP-N-acetylmuramoylalanine--D-glutamate ligase